MNLVEVLTTPENKAEFEAAWDSFESFIKGAENQSIAPEYHWVVEIKYSLPPLEPVDFSNSTAQWIFHDKETACAFITALQMKGSSFITALTLKAVCRWGEDSGQ